MPLQRRKKTNCAHSADQQEEKLTNQIQTMNDENPGIVVIHWPLMYGWMRFIGENVCVCTTVLILQPHLDISPSSLWSEVVLAVFLCNCCIIVTAEIWVGSLSLSPDVGQSISNSAPQDLSAYCTVMAATLILGLMWVAAQHYSLALPLILAIVPAVCVSCVCGVNLGALSLNVLTPTNILIHAPATNTTTTAVSSSESLVGDTGLSNKHDTVCGIQNSNGAVVDCNTDINNCTDIDTDNKIEEFIALKSTSDRDTNGVHENSNEIEFSAINCTNSSSSSSSMIDRTANNTVCTGVDQGLVQGLLDDHVYSTTDNRSEKITNSNTQSQPTSNNLMLKTISRCILYFIFFLGSPIGVQCVVFYLKCLAQLPTALSLLTLTLDPVHMLHDSDLYLKGLMALWIAPEVSLSLGLGLSLISYSKVTYNTVPYCTVRCCFLLIFLDFSDDNV